MAKKHTHKYHKVDTSAGPIWACGLPDCNHFMPTHFTELLPGKASICWECAEAFILTKENMKDSQPTCPNCQGIADLAAMVASQESAKTQ